MSLVSTLAKVAIGVAVAKGVSSMTKGGSTPRQTTNAGSGSIFGDEHSPGGGLSDILGGLTQAQPQSGQQSGGGLSDLLGGLMKQGGSGSQRGGGLGDLLGGGQSTGQGGGLSDMLGQVLGGGNQQASGGAPGGLGGLLEALAGGAAGTAASKPGAGSLGDMLNDALQGGGNMRQTPSQAEEDKAAVLLRAIIQAAKSDGRIDAQEQKALKEHLGDVSREEADFVNSEFTRPVDVQGLANDTPRGMEAQVYAMSLVGLDLDSKAEAQYLHDLGQALGIDARTSNSIHEQMGEPVLYT
ncbi:DUF533 domain-containing protein [Aliiroseovarius sp. F20344]|uniref:DUF533 domain-containing protein n=1 Tax=Aliiroseovarius sp. F20344 TaxID=2926414 RepID=UPI001FF260FC|nr:DUF533 domain-containing protein [Aliiroseovarius sp. F20344]MCK0142652.1 tellurite resistance TerB family protein [Aliiroseovarius sp. F20344]